MFAIRKTLPAVGVVTTVRIVSTGSSSSSSYSYYS